MYQIILPPYNLIETHNIKPYTIFSLPLLPTLFSINYISTTFRDKYDLMLTKVGKSGKLKIVYGGLDTEL